MPSDVESKQDNKVRVLLVEDDKLLSQLVSTKLKSSGYVPMIADDGLKALSLTEKFAPNVVILDLMLPGRDGYLILEDLKKIEKTKHIPVVVFSNRSDETDIDKAMKLGAQSYFVKAMTELDQVISEVEKLAKV